MKRRRRRDKTKEERTSRTGPALSMVCSTPEPTLPLCDNAVKWCNRKLVDSVLPEPDSPINDDRNRKQHRQQHAHHHHHQQQQQQQHHGHNNINSNIRVGIVAFPFSITAATATTICKVLCRCCFVCLFVCLFVFQRKTSRD